MTTAVVVQASEYIAFMRRKNSSHSGDIEDLKRQNQHLETQVCMWRLAYLVNCGKQPPITRISVKGFFSNCSETGIKSKLWL